MEWKILLQSFFMIFLAEMGDKSQFLMAAMTAQYRLRDILFGSGAAICVLNLLAVFVGSALGRFLPMALISIVAGLAFLAFAYTGLRETAEGEEAVSRGKYALPAIFGTYFLAELGDKTQLTVMALAADSGASWERTVATFAGASAGLFLSGILGLLVGVLLGKRLPKSVFSHISVLLFFVCGTVRLLQGFEDLFHSLPCSVLFAVIATALPTCLFVIFTWKGRKKRDVKTDASPTKPVPVQHRQ